MKIKTDITSKKINGNAQYPLIFKHLANNNNTFLKFVGLIKNLMDPEKITQQVNCYTYSLFKGLRFIFACRFLFFLTIILLTGSIRAKAQFGSSGGYDFEGDSPLWSLSVITGIDVPLGDIGTSYKGSPFYNLQIVRNFGPVSFGVGGGVRWLKPKQSFSKEPPNAVYPIDLDVNYSDMNSKILYATAIYNYEISDEIVAFGGLNVGYNNNTFATYGSVAGNPVFKVWTMENCLYVAPKLGAGYKFGNWQLNLESRFNYIKSNNPVEYKARVGAIPSNSSAYKTWATGVSIVLNF